MFKLLLLFIVVPAVELALLIELGSRIGTLPTLAIIVVTGIVGSTLARLQGLSAWSRFQEQMGRGELPAGTIGDGVLILLASALLVTPGVLTDFVGFSLLVPGVRGVIKAWLWQRLRASIQTGNVHVQVNGWDGFAGSQHSARTPREFDEDVIDIEPERQ